MEKLSSSADLYAMVFAITQGDLKLFDQTTEQFAQNVESKIKEGNEEKHSENTTKVEAKTTK